MITNIIFSKDRALQLHALLSSLDRYDGGIFKHKVIYTYTSEELSKGYDLCISLHPNVEFILESQLQTDILNNMNDLYSCFMVDDQIMFRDIPNVELSGLVVNGCFSLRLGNNIREPHLSYPLSVDGHIFRTCDIKPLIESIKFHNPNHLESRLQQYKSQFSLFYRYQCMVSIPHNRVSVKSHCSFSGLYTIEILNKYLLDGYEIDFDNMDFSGITNVHAVIDYKFKTR